MRRALELLAVALLGQGSALGADKTPQPTHSTRASRPAVAVQPAPTVSGATVSVQPATRSATMLADAPSLSALAPVMGGFEATQLIEPPPFEVGEANRVSLTVAHHFSREDARERVRQLLAYWGRRYGVTSEWRGFRVFVTGRVLGVDIRALFDVGDREVLALATDPGTALRGSAERYVDRKLRKYLSPTYDEP